MILSSAVSVIPLGLTLGLEFVGFIPVFIVICSALIAVTVFVPYVAVHALRARWPIRTAKFGARNGHLAVLLMAIYILLAMIDIDLTLALSAGLTAVVIAFAKKAAMALVIQRTRLFAADYFCAMTYPNAFVLVVIGQLLDEPFLVQVATWYLLPMSVLAVFDGAYARAASRRVDESQIRRLVKADSQTD